MARGLSYRVGRSVAEKLAAGAVAGILICVSPSVQRTEMFRVTREFEFCFGHRLLDYDGKCRNLHGHNGKACVTLESDCLDRLGMLVDFVEIKRVVGTWIDNTFDHTLLLHKDDPLVKSLRAAGEKVLPLDMSPTTENMAKLIFEYARDQGLPVVEVTMWETPYSYATYRPE